MAVATAIVGSAVIGAGASIYSSNRASRSAERGANRAADAQAYSTELQVEEIRRQFDAQMEMLRPMIEQQYAAQAAFREILGFGTYNEETGQYEGGNVGFGQPGGFFDPNLNPMRLGADTGAESELGQQVQNTLLAGRTPEEDLAIRRARETGLFNGVDDDSLVQHVRNLQNAGTPLDMDTLYAAVNNDRLAGGDRGADDYVQQVQNSLLAPGTIQDDPRFQHARDTAVVGDTFETSRGYEFAREEMGRELDRKNSAGGGNYGGRALLEAQRRAQGLADQEYYNWVGARHMDLSREDRAIDAYQGRQAMDRGRMDRALENRYGREAMDATRRDSAIMNYLQRRGIDIGREDAAVGDARRREELDLARGDAALDDYFRRMMSDNARMEGAIQYNTGLNAADRQRQDQSYYNYLNMLMGTANSGAVNTGVSAAGAAGSQVAGAYGNQGNYLSSLWSNLGNTQGQIALGEGANVNNAIQGGLNNWMMMRYLGL